MRAERSATRRAAPLARLLRLALARPTLAFGLAVAALTLPSLGAKDLWFPDETRHAAVLVQMVVHGHWLALRLGETFYADKPPLCFGLVALLALATGSTAPPVFMAAAALSGWAYLAALARLGRAAGLGRPAVLTAGLMLLSCWFFVERLHHPRMGLLFAALILWAQAEFLSALRTGRGAVAGWVAAGLAVLTKGPAGAALPLAALPAGLAIRRPAPGLRRGLGRGALAFLGIMAAYLGGVWWTAGPEAVRALVVDQSLGRALGAESLSQPWHWYLAPLAAAVLPWTLALAAVRARHLRAPGAALLWAGFAAGLAVLSVADYKAAHFLVPLLGPFALALAHALWRAPARLRRALWAGMAGLWALAAAAPFAARWTLWPEAVQGELAVAAAAGATALLPWRLRRRGPAVFAAAAVLGAVLTALPYYQLTVRGPNAVMSPRAAGAILAAHHARGHATAEFHPSYRGLFDYHAGHAVTQIADPAALDALVAAAPCGVVAIRPRDLEAWAGAPADLERLAEQRPDYARYVLVRWGGPACAAPPPQPAASASCACRQSAA